MIKRIITLIVLLGVSGSVWAKNPLSLPPTPTEKDKKKFCEPKVIGQSLHHKEGKFCDKDTESVAENCKWAYDYCRENKKFQGSKCENKCKEWLNTTLKSKKAERDELQKEMDEGYSVADLENAYIKIRGKEDPNEDIEDYYRFTDTYTKDRKTLYNTLVKEVDNLLQDQQEWVE